MKKPTGWVLACLAVSVALPLPAVGQKAGANLELGVKLCGPDPLLNETEAEFTRRIAVEQNAPDWIWTAVDNMQAGPETMSFTFKQVGNERVLLANGMVDDAAATHLRQALDRFAPISEVWLNSPGGNSQVGVQMGDMMRGEMIGTRVRTGNGCASACSTAFLGGVMRKVEEGAVYGVHMYSTEISGAERVNLSQDIFNDIQWQGAKGASDRMKYVQRMGVSVKWLDIWSGTRPGCMTFMSQDEMRTAFVNNID